MDLFYTGLTAGIIVLLILSQLFRRSFDPFAPIWLFLAGYAQIYIVQAINYRDYAYRARGEAVATQASIRALWALALFVAVYYSGITKRLAAWLPRAPRNWSPTLVVGVSPLLIFWGLVCSVLSIRVGTVGATEDSIIYQFPMLLLVGGVMILVTGRQPDRPNPFMTLLGVLVCASYSAIWMFNAKRSHALFGVLAGVCAFYLPRYRRPSLPIMAATGLTCVMAVTIAIGWRGTTRYDQNIIGFIEYLSELDPSAVLVNLNMKERDPDRNEIDPVSKETEEHGGFLLMLDTVPEKSPYDYGSSYMRIFSTFIPRVIWPDKPLYGRHEWVSAWIAGSEEPRDENFTGPAIGLLGAAQLNGGPIATAIVMTVLALLLRTAYDYYRYYAASPWAQVWWALTYFNSWLMTANDDPFVWFYYVYGYTVFPVMIALWTGLKLSGPAGELQLSPSGIASYPEHA